MPRWGSEFDSRRPHQHFPVATLCAARNWHLEFIRPYSAKFGLQGGGHAMEHIMAKLLQDFEQGKMNRRQLIQSLTLAATAAAASAVPALGGRIAHHRSQRE